MQNFFPMFILEPLKEVPQEVLFKSNSPKNAMRDQNKINRIWFSFPEQWANQLNKDSIIGFRNFYIVKEDRYIVFNLDITVYENLGLEERNTLFSLSGKQRFWIGHGDSLTKIPYIFEEFWYQNMKTIIVNNEVANEQLNNKNPIRKTRIGFFCLYFFNEYKLCGSGRVKMKSEICTEKLGSLLGILVGKDEFIIIRCIGKLDFKSIELTMLLSESKDHALFRIGIIV